MVVLSVVTNSNPFTFKLETPVRYPAFIKLFSLCVHMLNSFPAVCFVRCDLIDQSQNLYNGSNSDILSVLHMHNLPEEHLRFKQSDANVFRKVSAPEYVYSITLSLTDSQRHPIDLKGKQVIYEIELN